jgi:hypothetical protein
MKKKSLKIRIIALFLGMGILIAASPLLVNAVGPDTDAQEFMQVDILHSAGYTGNGVTLAIVEAGLTNHSYFTDTSLNYFNVTDSDITGPITDWGSSQIGDPSEHGTFVFGAAKQFAPDIDLVFYGTQSLNMGRVRDALYHLAVNYDTYGVDVLSISWGILYPEYMDQAIKSNITNSLSTLVSGGVTIFISSGNDAEDIVSWPASLAPTYDGLMSIGNVNETGYRHVDSNYGDDLELCAVGVNISTTSSITGGWSSETGTSMSAPIAAGIAACLIEQYNTVPSAQRPASITPSFIEDRLRDNAVIFDEEPELYEYGDGVIRAAKSMLNWMDYVDQDYDQDYGTITDFSNLTSGIGAASFAETSEYDYTHDYEHFSSTTFPPSGWSRSNWYRVSSGGQPGAYAKTEASGYLISETYDTSDANKVYLDFYQKSGTDGNLYVYAYDKYGNYDLIGTHGLGFPWQYESWSSTDSQYQHEDFKIKYYAQLYGSQSVYWCVDTHHIKLRMSSYKFKHQLRFTGLDSDVYTNATLYLNISSHSGSENLILEWYNSTSEGWTELSSVISQGNYIYEVGDYITGTDFIVRIRGASEVLDTSQDTWTFSYLYLRVLDPSISYYSP